MSVDLKPCPFCGGEATVSKAFGEGSYHTIGCVNDDCCCPRLFVESDESNKAKMIASWNTRRQPKVFNNLSATGIATDEEVKNIELCLMTRLLDDDCGNGAALLSRILNRLAKAESAEQPVELSDFERFEREDNLKISGDLAACYGKQEPAQPVDCREAFEASMQGRGYDLRVRSGRYLDNSVSLQYVGFCEAWKLKSPERESCWVDANQRLPDKSGYYLVITTSDKWRATYYQGDQFVVMFKYGKFEVANDVRITYWQELPEPPTNENYEPLGDKDCKKCNGSGSTSEGTPNMYERGSRRTAALYGCALSKIEDGASDA